MRELHHQPISSTALDAHGERLSKDELRGLFDKLPSELVINDSHDLSKPSAAVARNLRFVQLPSGEWAIVADITIHDEAVFERSGGFSLAWVANGYTIFPDRDPDIQVLINMRLFRRSLALSLIHVSTDQANIVARELKQKGLLASAIILVEFIGVSALAGFIGKAGADAYDKLLGILRNSPNDLHEPQSANVLIHFLVPRHLNPYDAEIIVEISTEQLEHLRVGALSFQDAIDQARLVPHADAARKIVVKASGNPPRWHLSGYEKSSGVRIRI